MATKRKRLKKGFSERADKTLMYREQYNGQPICVYGQTQKECFAKAEKKRHEIDDFINGLVSKADTLTLDEFYEVWAANRAEGEVERSTSYTKDRTCYFYIKPYLGKLKLKDISAENIKRVRSELRKEERKTHNKKKAKALKTTTANQAVHLLRSMFNTAINEGILRYNPCNAVKDLKRDVSETEARDTIHRGLSAEDQELFLNYAESRYYYPLYDFWFSTGLRVGEIEALTWSDVDFKTDMIHITKSVGTSGHKRSDSYIKQPKNDESKRDIPLNNRIRLALARQKEQQKALGYSDFLVFTNTRGDRLERNTINEAIRCVVKSIQKDGHAFEKITSHAFRATFATRAVERGVPITTLQKLMGHAKIETTMKYYVHVHDAVKIEAMRLMDDVG